MLQDPEIITHRLRLRYLSQVQDGIGERIFDFSQTKTNTTAFRIAGGDAALMDRCVSPDIPSHDVAESSNSAAFRTGLASPVSTNLSEDVAIGGTLRRTATDLSLTARRSRNNLHEDFNVARLNPALRDDEASDQSDISDNEDVVHSGIYGSQNKHLFMMDLHKKIAEEPKFEKMPVRRRGISDAGVTYRASILPQARRPTVSASRNGSESDLSRGGGLSIVSNGFMPILPGAPCEPPLIGNVQIDSQDAISNYPDVLASFEATEDSSEDEYDMTRSSTTNAELPVVDLRTVLHRNFSGSNISVLGSLPKSKPRPESVFQPTSGLTAMIKASDAAEVNPLERKYGVLSGKGDLKPLKLKIYRPSAVQPTLSFEVVIKSTATVVDTIGYALLRYIEEKREPLLESSQKDPNYWTLRIVEDDGELDEDFPALERTRPISKFSFDEFAIVEATSTQLAENQALTPNPMNIKPTLTSIPEVNIQPASGPPSAHAATQPLPSANLAENILGSTANSASLASTNTTTPSTAYRPAARAPGASVLLKVRLRTEANPASAVHAQSTVLDVTTETYLGDVLDQVCKRRNLDKIMFSLRIAGTNVVVPSDRTVESLQGRTELLLVRKRATDLLTDTVMPRSMTPNAPILSSTFAGTRSALAESSSLTSHIPDIVTSNTYQHWVVWRRQPMSFMGRHERILAIDGEYVHISPSESKTMFESPKTSSMHVGQIVACKQSRKIPVNFKIVIIKAGQTKRYDFESTRPQEAETIVGKIKSLTRNWASHKGIRQSRMVV